MLNKEKTGLVKPIGDCFKCRSCYIYETKDWGLCCRGLSGGRFIDESNRYSSPLRCSYAKERKLFECTDCEDYFFPTGHCLLLQEQVYVDLQCDLMEGV